MAAKLPDVQPNSSQSGKPARKQTGLRSVGKTGRKRSQATRQAVEQAAALRPDGVRCEFPHVAVLMSDNLVVPCTGNATGVDPHHRVLRSADPTQIGVADNIVFVCRAAHNAIHDHPAIARRYGLYNPR
jgi:hypothetical protein